VNRSELQKKIISIMNSDETYPAFSSATVLSALSWLYGASVRLRGSFYAKGWLTTRILPRPVVSVGNLTVGGTGKTPMTLYLAGLIKQMGYRVAIVSRGYKGDSRRTPLVVGNGRAVACDVRRSGDEPFLMASLLKDVPVVVGRDRYAAGNLAIRHFSPDILLLDDAFQHLKLHRDLNLLLLDAGRPFGNNNLAPRGTLREPSSALRRSDAVVFTRWNPQLADRTALLLKDKMTFHAIHEPVVRLVLPAESAGQHLGSHGEIGIDISILRKQSLFGFSGLADNNSFKDSILKTGATLKGMLGFEDHHWFTQADLSAIISAARKSEADCLVTTDKDYVRLNQTWKWPLPLIVLGVAIRVADPNKQWHEFIRERLMRLTKSGDLNSRL
jgi:tetraacyldisaccharide 4'-kinase